MFSDRLLWIRFALLALSYGLLCHWGGRIRGREAADIVACLSDPRAYHDVPVFGSGHLVTAVREGGFEVDYPDFRVDVVSDARVIPGQHVEFAGRFHRDGSVRADTVIVLPWYRTKRVVMLLGSIAALVFVGAIFLRSRETRFDSGLIEERPCPTP